MHAHFETTVYHRHSHESYSFGVTEDGAQSFRCRGAGHTSASGMVMAFNPDDPHDGYPADESGFTYRMVHIGTELVARVLADLAPAKAGLPLFAQPVHTDPELAGRVRALHRGLAGGASALRRDELLTAAVGALARRAAVPVAAVPVVAAPVVAAPVVAATVLATTAAGELTGGRIAAASSARRARDVLQAAPLTDISGSQLAAAAGCSRFALHRAFVAAYGLTPAGYQRQIRLRLARRLIADGCPISDAAATSGFADQSHLTRWFVRHYAITPGAYRRAALAGRS
jgi:AraC-like DNA-binding protein